MVALLSGFVVLGPFADESVLYQVGSITLGTVLVSLCFSLLTEDYSWTDRLWSTLPVAFAWIYAYKAGFSSPPVIVAALLATIWGGLGLHSILPDAEVQRRRRLSLEDPQGENWEPYWMVLLQPALYRFLSTIPVHRIHQPSGGDSPPQSECSILSSLLHCHILVYLFPEYRDHCRPTTVHVPASQVPNTPPQKRQS